jgi:hypothetical protein
VQHQASRRDFLRAAATAAALALPVGLGRSSAHAEATSRRPQIPGIATDALGRRHSLAYLGVYQPATIPGCSAPAALETFIGRRFAINHHFRSPPEADWAALRAHLQDDLCAGRIPMVSYAAGKSPGFPDTEAGAQRAAFARLVATAQGERDAYIDGQAAALAALEAPLFLRFTWEFDIRYLGPAGATAFRAAWRHVHARFQRAGATNVAFVWCPTWYAYESGTAARFYPGDRVVDWIGADGYARAPYYRSFAGLFTAAHAFAVHRGKPFMVAETGVQRLSRQDGAIVGRTAQSSWLDELRRVLAADEFTNLKAVLYFDADGDDRPQPNHWKLTVPDHGPAARSFRALAWSPRLTTAAPAWRPAPLVPPVSPRAI